MINKKLTLTLLFFAVSIFGLHYTVNEYFLDEVLPYRLILKINLFVTLLTYAVVNTIESIRHKFPNKIGFGYLAFVFIKMVISVVFLFPFLQEKLDNVKALILSFFTIFFSHLIFEVYLIIKQLKND